MSSDASQHRTQKRVLIIHSEGNTFNNPSLKCIIDLLLEKGCRVDLRYPTSSAPMPRVAGVHFLPYGQITRRIKALLLDWLCSWNLALLGALLERLAVYGNYDLILGVDRQGLIEASLLHKLTATPCAFISFEIMFESETSARYKRLERHASRGVSLWLVQDDVRAQLLERENGLQASNKVLLPLASAGIGTPGTARLRDQLRIPADKKVAIAIGSMTGWAMTRRILQSVGDWPEDWALIVHERYGMTSESLRHELAAVEPLLGRKIFVSDAATDMVDDMRDVLAGVSAGLAFYEPDYKNPFTGKNLEHLGTASGKISTYLRYGVPVVLNEIGLYSDEARRFGFGRIAENPEQIAAVLGQFHVERCSSAASDYFRQKLDFNIHRDRIWSTLRELMAGGEPVGA